MANEEHLKIIRRGPKAWNMTSLKVTDLNGAKGGTYD
jgi:hypothetical protein